MRKVFFTLAFGVATIFATAQSPYSYYYQGQKINLVVDRQHIIVVASPEFLQSSQAVSLFEILQLEQESNSQSQGRIRMKFKTEITLLEYENAVSSLRQHPQIQKVCPFFEKGDEPIGTCDIFYLKLKNIGDTALLQTIAQQQNVQVLRQVPYMPLWSILSLKNSNFKNSVEATNFFYETDLFADTDPAFMFKFKTSSSPNDPQFHKQWGLSAEYGINICDAWVLSSGAGVKVAVVDNGIDFSHNDLAQNIHPLNCKAADTTSPSVYNPLPAFSHGMHVAGIIAAVKDNNLQISGVSPHSKIMGVSHDLITDIYNPNDTAISVELANGISWAWQNGADVINCSWGDQGGQLHSNFKTIILEDAIIQALTLGRGGLGTVVVFAAGNFGANINSIDYPGKFCDSILVVGSIDIDGIRANRSGRGSQLDLVSPGVNILSTMPNNEIDYMSGTSMAAPHCAGVACLCLSINPNLTRQQVCNIIERSAQKLKNYTYSNVPNRPNGLWDDSTTTGYGALNAYAAVLLAARGDTTSSCLLIRDTPDDIGLNPNTSSLPLFESPDIYVRRNNDGEKFHQEPCLNDTSYINIRIRNAGWYATKGGETLRIYVRRTDSASLWDGKWQGVSLPIKPLLPGQDITYTIPYYFQNAPAFTILSFIDTIVPTAPTVPIIDLVKNSHKIAMRNLTLTDRLDLVLMDDGGDLGDEPYINFYTNDWKNDRFFTRNQLDSTFENDQLPIPDSTIYFNFRVINYGCIPSTPADSVKLYWAKSGTTLAWDSCWNIISTSPIPILNKNRMEDFRIPWYNVPNLFSYRYIFDSPWNFHILARIISNEDTMSLESQDVLQNIRNNNNITGKAIFIGYFLATNYTNYHEFS